MTHRSFILPGERQDRKHHPHAHPHHPHQPYLHKSGTHSKSQSYKQKLIPNSTVSLLAITVGVHAFLHRTSYEEIKNSEITVIEGAHPAAPIGPTHQLAD